MRRARSLAVIGLAVVLATACSSSPAAVTPAASGTAAPTTPTAKLPRPAHVMVVIFENEDAEAVVGSPQAPYLTELAKSGATFTDAHGETHPSQPNYLALFSGNTQGVTGNQCPVELTGENLAAQLITAGETFIGYSEGLPEPGYTGCRSGKYARKHNPWVNFRDLPPSINQPFSALPADYAQLPTVSFVVPDMCNDMHNCPVATGDAWARKHLAPYVAWAKQHESLLIVTFDEDSGTEENRIPTIVAGAFVRPTVSKQRIDHYSVLRTLEDLYGLAPLGQASIAAPLAGIWTTP